MATKKLSENEITPVETVMISKPNFEMMKVTIVGTSCLVVERFSKKAELMAKMAEGQQSKNKKDRHARDYEQEAEESKYICVNGGWEGINASCIRNACISACRVANFKMTMAKLSLFVQAQGYDRDGIPLIRVYGPSRTMTMPTRNATGVIDIRSRPQYQEWACQFTVHYDADQFSAQSIMNLLERAGMQVGIGAGRPDSKKSSGCGWGTFRTAYPGEDLSRFGL